MGNLCNKIHGKRLCWVTGLSCLTVFGTGIFKPAAGGYPLEQLLLLAGVCIFYAYALRRIKDAAWGKRDIACVIIPAVLLAGFMVVGYSFEQTDSLHLVIGGKRKAIKALIAFAGYGVAFATASALFYAWLRDFKLFSDEREIQENGLLGRYKTLLLRSPFRTAFLTLLVIYIPYIILSYPAIFMGDTDAMILQAFNIPEWTSNYLNLIDENVRLNGHHPIVYTMFIHVCLLAGKAVFGSYNVGIFMVALCQLLGVCAVVAASVRVMVRMKVRENILLALLAYYAFAPRIQDYMFLMTKDVFMACSMMMFLLSVFSLLQGRTAGKKAVAELILFGIAIGLIRNDGKYIVLGSIAIMMFLLKKRRIALLISGAAIAVCAGLFFNVLMPTLHITPTSRREVLSIPFQQTARYFRDYESEVTAEEWVAVNAVLDAGSLAQRYNPILSDPVKATFREGTTDEEMKAYFKAWLKMGLKHKGVYVQATLNNYYNYFYPGMRLVGAYSYSWSQDCMKSTNNNEAIAFSFRHPKKLDKARKLYEAFRERVFELPVLSLLKSAAVYVWLLILLVLYLIKTKCYRALALTAPLALSVGVCVLGPCNGEYFRYLCGVSVCLPIVFILCLCVIRCCNKAEKTNG